MRKDYSKKFLAKEIFKQKDFSLNLVEIFLLLIIIFGIEIISGIITAIGGAVAISLIKFSNDITWQAAILTEIIIICLLISLAITVHQGFLKGLGIGGLILIPSLILSLVLSEAEISTWIGLAFFAGIGSLSLIFAGLVILAMSATGLMAVLKFRSIAITINFSVPVFAAKILPGIEAIPTAIIISAVGNYIALRALAGDKNFAWVRSFAVAFAAWRGISFQRADLTDADFTKANLKNTDFREANVTRTCWYKAKGLELARLGGTILINPVVRDLLVNKDGKNNKSLIGLNLKGANLAGANLRGVDLTGSDLSDATLEAACLEQAILVGANLKGTNLSGADFSYANLKEADLTEANLQRACLEWTNLTNALAVGADFIQAKLTGACLGEVWNIDSTTKLEQVDCQYVFFREHPHPITGDRERRPHDPDKIFEPGDFEKLYKKIMNTVQILLRNGTHKEAFAVAFHKLMEDNPEFTFQGIEKKGNDTLLTLEVPEGTDKGKVQRSFEEVYEARLEAQKQTALLEAEIRHSKNITEIIGLLVSRPIINEVNVTAESKAMNESNDQSRKIEIGSVGRDFNASGQALNLGDIDISGTVTNTIGQLQESDAPEAPKLAELLKQLQATIEADTNLTDKNKEKALKQVKALAEAAQNPKKEEQQDLADTAITMLKGIITGLPSAATLIEACTKIASLFGLA